MKLRGFLTGGALAVALVLTSCGGGASGDTGGAASEGTSITVGTDNAAELKFVPDMVEAPANTPVTLTFNNTSTQPHNLVFQEGITAKTNDLVAAGASETINFTTPAAGTYPFVCTIHPTMVGTLTVN